MLSIHRLVQAVLKESMDQADPTHMGRAHRASRQRCLSRGHLWHWRNISIQYYCPTSRSARRSSNNTISISRRRRNCSTRPEHILYFHGFYPQSQSLHQQALAIREQVFGSEHPAVAESLNALAMLSRIQGDYEQAEGFHQQALTIREKMLGPEHPATAQSLNNLGVLYRNQGKYEQAEPLLTAGTQHQ